MYICFMDYIAEYVKYSVGTLPVTSMTQVTLFSFGRLLSPPQAGDSRESFVEYSVINFSASGMLHR